MNRPTKRATQLKSLDKLCDDFESQWRQGARPSMASFIERVADEQRAAAFRDLLALDIEYRRDGDEQPQAADYEGPFAEFVDEIQAVFGTSAGERETAFLEATIDSQVDYSADADVPTHIEGYQLLGEIARGGMGVVYKARQESLDRTVALKVVLSGDKPLPHIAERFIAEAKTAAKLQHPGIVAVHEVGQTEGRPYFSMEYVEGDTLSELLREGTIPQHEAARHIKEIAETIHFAHELGVLHRDIKPSNVMLDQLGRLRVMDFGLAKHVEADTNLTASGQILGTPGFMSPEQARGEHDKVDRRSDVYSLGALLYSLLTGKAPFKSESIADLMAQVIRDDPVPPRRLDPSVDRSLEQICLKCLAKRREDRYETAEALAKDLAVYLEQQPEQRMAESKRRFLFVGTSIAAMLLAAAIVIKIKLGDKKFVIKSNAGSEATVEGEKTTNANSDASTDKRNREAESSIQRRQRNDAPSALDQLRREGIDPYELAFAGDGYPERAPAELVGVLGQSLGRHEGGANGGGVSADGKMIATTGRGTTIRAWDARTMQQLFVRTFDDGGWWKTCFTKGCATLAVTGSHREIKFLDMSRDGRQIALVQACDDDANEIGVWAPHYTEATNTFSVWVNIGDNARQIRSWKCDERGIPIGDGVTFDVDDKTACMAVNSDGSMLATGCSDGRVQLWNLTSEAKVVAEVQSQGAAIGRIAFSPDRKQLAAACGPTGCEVWTVTGDELTPKQVLRGRLTDSYHHHTHIAYSPDGRYLASGYRMAAIALWDISGASPVLVSEIHLPYSELLNEISFTPDGTTLIWCANDGLVRQIDVTARPPQLRNAPAGHLGRNAKVEYISQDGSLLLTRANDDRLIPWSFIDGRFEERDATKLVSQAHFCEVNRAGTVLAAASLNHGPIQLFRWNDGQMDLRNRLTPQPVTRALAMSQDGSLLATANRDGNVVLSDIANNENTEISTYLPTAAKSESAAFSPDGSLLAVSGAPSEGEMGIRLWDISQSLPKHLYHLDIVTTAHADAIRFFPDGQRILQTGSNGIFVTDISGDRPREVFACKTIEGFGQHGDISPDGTKIAIQISGSRLQLLETETFSVLREWTFTAPAQPKFAPDGRHLLVGNTNGTVYVLRIGGQ